MALVGCLAAARPSQAHAPEQRHEQLLVVAGEHRAAGRHEQALAAYAEAFEAMTPELRVSGVGELVALEAGNAALEDYQARGERESLVRGRAVVVAFIESIKTARPGVETVPMDGAKRLLSQIDQAMPAAEPAVPEAGEAAGEEAASEDIEPVGSDEPASPAEADEPRARGGPLGAMGKAGVALLVVGGVSVNAGVALLIRSPTYFPRDDPNATRITTTRPPGWAMLGGGLTSVVVGAVLLGIDRQRARAKTARAGEARRIAVSAQAWLTSDVQGLGLHGRF